MATTPVPRIDTDRLLLRAPEVADAEGMFRAYAYDPQVTRYLIWRPHKNVEETRAYLARLVAHNGEHNSFTWLIIRRLDAQIVGALALRAGGDVGYVLARTAWGQGYMTEALIALLSFAFDKAGHTRVWGVCDVDNLASARVMEKAGLRPDGLLPAYMLHPNLSEELRDVYRFAVTRAEWLENPHYLGD